jgi:acyl-CoA synthetase (NDP forming)
MTESSTGHDFPSLQRFFDARGVAVIGASQDESKIGGRPLRYLEGSGYSGAVYPVNPKYDEVRGSQCWPSAEAIPHDVDLALLAVPGAHVNAAIDDCASAGIPFAIVFSSGFAELGPEGRERQDAILARARDGGVQILGPNTLGATSSPSGLIASFSTVFDRHSELLPGRVGFVSQSGALGAIIYALAQDRGLGFSRFVATGNEADIDVADVLAYMADDEETVAIGGYLESVKDGARFLAAAERAAAAGKPMSFLKVGRSEAGSRAAESHTGALAGSDSIYDAALRQAGIVRATDLEGLLDFLDHQASPHPISRDGGVAVLTVSGGAGVWTADRLADFGINLATLAPETTFRLTEALPPFGSPHNPVDVTGQVGSQTELLQPCLDAILEDPGVSTLIIMLGLLERNGEELAHQVVESARAHPDTSIAVAWLAGPASAYEVLERGGIPVFDDLARCVTMVGASVTAVRLTHREDGGGKAPTTPILLSDGLLASGGPLTERQAKDEFAKLGIAIPRGRLCETREDTLHTAADLRFPLVLKGQVQGMAHKTENRMVHLGLDDVEAVGSAYDELVVAMEAAAGEQRIEGVLIEEMAGPGVEVIVGSFHDDVFGPTVMFGLGGVMVEILQDVAFRVAPVDLEGALAMIGETRGGQILDGFRGGPVYDKRAIAEVISAVSQAAVANRTTVREIEINPLRVYPEGDGVIALDGLIVLHERPERRSAAIVAG